MGVLNVSEAPTTGSSLMTVQWELSSNCYLSWLYRFLIYQLVALWKTRHSWRGMRFNSQWSLTKYLEIY